VDAADGTVVREFATDEFGRVVTDTAPGFTPFGFAGGLYDLDTGLVRFGARDYDAHVGRWVAKDPIRFEGGQKNMYAYVDNDPVNWTDPQGLFLDCYLDFADTRDAQEDCNKEYEEKCGGIVSPSECSTDTEFECLDEARWKRRCLAEKGQSIELAAASCGEDYAEGQPFALLKKWFRRKVLRRIRRWF
jgi:RHS repeat-associated protein